MDNTTNTYLPPTPDEVFNVIAPTMADVDYFFEQVISRSLHDPETAKHLLAGSSAKIEVDRTLYKTYGEEIENRLIEQGWSVLWDWDRVGLKEDNGMQTKRLIIWFERKSHDAIEPTVEPKFPLTASDKLQALNDALSAIATPIFETIANMILALLKRLGMD